MLTVGVSKLANRTLIAAILWDESAGRVSVKVGERGGKRHEKRSRRRKALGIL